MKDHPSLAGVIERLEELAREFGGDTPLVVHSRGEGALFNVKGIKPVSGNIHDFPNPEGRAQPPSGYYAAVEIA